MTEVQFRFDPKRCTGCEACVLACWMENRAAQAQPWRRVHTFNPMRHPDLPVFHLSLACHHCEDPACLAHCPAKAYTRDPDTGAVVLHPERCMGCRYCTWACPHDAPRYDPVRGTVAKCTFCLDRQQQGLRPACVARCPVEALGVENRTSYKGLLPPGFPQTETLPAIRFLPGPRRPPPATAAPAKGVVARLFQTILIVPEPKITLRKEWTLVAFTATLAVLVGRMWAVAAGRPLRHPWVLLGAGILAMLCSTWHLGRPLRAWRALLNVGSSWLSRELALASVFLLLSGLNLLVRPQNRVLGWAAALAGMAALYAVDRVYQVAVKVGPLNFHSAQALFTGLYLAGLMAGWWPLALAAGLVKAALYGIRKTYFQLQGRGGRAWLSGTRMLLGFVVPMLVGGGLGVLAAVLGDLLDRCEYYGELEIPAPALSMARSVRSALATDD